MNCERLPFLKQPLGYNPIDTIGVVLVPSFVNFKHSSSVSIVNLH